MIKCSTNLDNLVIVNNYFIENKRVKKKIITTNLSDCEEEVLILILSSMEKKFKKVVETMCVIFNLPNPEIKGLTAKSRDYNFKICKNKSTGILQFYFLIYRKNNNNKRIVDKIIFTYSEFNNYYNQIM